MKLLNILYILILLSNICYSQTLRTKYIISKHSSNKSSNEVKPFREISEVIYIDLQQKKITILLNEESYYFSLLSSGIDEFLPSGQKKTKWFCKDENQKTCIVTKIEQQSTGDVEISILYESPYYLAIMRGKKETEVISKSDKTILHFVIHESAMAETPYSKGDLDWKKRTGHIRFDTKQNTIYIYCSGLTFDLKITKAEESVDSKHSIFLYRCIDKIYDKYIVCQTIPKLSHHEIDSNNTFILFYVIADDGSTIYFKTQSE